LQGFISRTATCPGPGLTVSVLTNSLDGMAGMWVDGVLRILQVFARHGPPRRRVAERRGPRGGPRGATDPLPRGANGFAGGPGLPNPFADAVEVAVIGRDQGRIAQTDGYGSYGEAASLERNARGRVTAVRFAGGRLLPEAKLAKEVAARYAGKRKQRRRA